MIRVLLAAWAYIGSLAGVLTSAMVVAATLSAFPSNYNESFGPHVPAVSKMYAEQLHYAPAAMEVIAVLSVVLVIYFWRSTKPMDVKCFYVALVSVLNYLVALFPVVMLVLAYFMLPKLANGA